MTEAWKTALPLARKMVLLALCDSANDEGVCFPSVLTIVKKCSLAERSVREHLSYLEEDGFVVREFRDGRGSIYHITNPCVWRTPALNAPLRQTQDTPAPSAPTPAPSAPITITKPKPNQSCASDDARFLKFWLAYPKKKSKGTAEKAWTKLHPDSALFEAMMRGLLKAKASRDWSKSAGEFIPHPATWISARGWEDEHEMQQQRQVSL